MIGLLKKITNIKDRRYKQAIKTSSLAFVAQGVQMLTAVVSVPLVLNAVGSERYGLWMTLSSILLFVTFSDFGMGIGMQNIMSYAKAQDDKDNLKKSFTTTIVFGAILFSVLILISYFIIPFVDLTTWFKYQDKSISREILPATQAVFLVLSFGILSGLVQRAFDAYQEGYYSRIILVGSRLLSLLLLFWAVKTKQDLSTIILVSSGLPNLMLTLGIFWLYKNHPYLLFNHKDISKLVFLQIFKTGIAGLGASIAIFLLNSLTPLILSSGYGLKESAKYLVLTRLLNFILLFVNIIFLPFWPAVADAHVKKDFAWLNLLYTRINKLFLSIGFPMFILLLLTSKWLILVWTGKESILPSFSLIFICISYTVLSVWNTIICVFLNGMSLFKGQATFGILIAGISIFIAILSTKKIDPTGVVFIITTGMLIRCIYLHFELRKNMKINNDNFLTGEPS
ncbi:MAG TPA: lipopolysaccharide biosynthesis protein [Mucilaginibacter sp.]|jgi:O-antigen/teichoic acid export membrane protein